VGTDDRPSTRPVGRPPRIDRDAIADAVLELGLANVEMKQVAEHLGVSVAGLYHHVANRKELLLLAAERWLSRRRLPEDRGQHWSEWLREWARYSRQAFIDEPQVFIEYLGGAISAEKTLEVYDSVLRVLTAQGFSPADALATWSAVGQLASGSAVDQIRLRAAAERGHPEPVELERLLAAHAPDELTGLRGTAGVTPPGPDELFEWQLTTLLIGVAVRRGEPWEPMAGDEGR
jgi:AcrR family transcriptional regulator